MDDEQSEISNVAIISYHSPPNLGSLGADIGSGNIGGMSSDLAQLAIGLDSLGISVTIFTSNQVRTDETLEEKVGRNIYLVQIPTGEPTYDNNELKLITRRDKFTVDVLPYCAQHTKPQIIYGNYRLSWLAAKALGEKYGVPIVYKFHTLETTKTNLILSNGLDLERIAEEEEIARLVDGIIVSTPACIEDLKSMGISNDKIYEVPPGFNPEIFYPRDKSEAKRALGLPLDEYVILSVGRPDPIKNYNILIQALKLVKDGSKLYIVGGNSDDKERVRLVNLSKRLGIEDNVVFKDKINQQHLASWYNAADVLVMPSQYETFGMVALEAMACGTPVIASNVGGLHHLVVNEETGYLVVPNDPQTLAEHLKYIFENDGMRRDMGTRALEHSQKYSLETTTPTMLDAYQKVRELYLSQKVIVRNS